MPQAIAVFQSATDGASGDDAAVLAALAEPDAFDVIYQAYARRVYRFVRPFVLSDEESADLTQQVFIKVWGALPRYRPGRAPFSAWLFAIARNAATDAYRRRRRVEPLEAAGTLSAQAGDPEASILATERLRTLRARIESLDLRKRQLLALRFGAGLTAREIAAVVSRPETAVKKELTRTINALKELYRE